MNIGLEDLRWKGPDPDPGAMDAHKDLLGEAGYRAETPLRLLVRAIIAANPNDEGDPKAREAEALKALLGEARSGPRGADDEALLREIARRYFAAFMAPGAPRGKMVRGKFWEPPLDPIIQEVVPGEGLVRGRGSAGNIRRTLTRKFREQQEILLQRVTGESDWEARDLEQRIGAFIRNVLGMDPAKGRGRESD